MLNRLNLGIVLFLGLLILLGAIKQNPESEFTTADKANLRATLLQELVELDLARLHQRDYDYLDSLDAGYDEDNQQYYLDHTDAGSISYADSYLLIINYQATGSTEIRIFSPDRNAAEWLCCRLRKRGNRLYTRVVFQPGGACGNLLAIEPMPTGRMPELAMLEPD
ncbi:MAG TPA: hypothetical protein PLM07_04155 [Candidatus Rifleibacterium sp.]|nr:hypothetical protein [Candidatus Rifleibacterium sp.]HPT45078.1 hypothetical protein [Candidatus Rifleibacterium sp.]